jgi:hypothetical protein
VKKIDAMPTGVRLLWIGSAAIGLAAVILFDFGWTAGSCGDASPGTSESSSCSSGPAIGVVPAAVLTVAGVIYAILAIRHALRRRHESSK